MLILFSELRNVSDYQACYINPKPKISLVGRNDGKKHAPYEKALNGWI